MTRAVAGVGCLLVVQVLSAGDARGQRAPKKAPPAEEPPPAPASTPPLKPPGPAIAISVREAVTSALSFNPQLARTTLEAKIAGVEVERQRGQFDPVVNVTGAHRAENAYVVSGSDPTVAASTTALEGSVTGRTHWGGQYSLTASGGRTSGFSLTPSLLPTFDSLISARYTQSLLRGGGFTANRGRIERAELSAQSSDDTQSTARLALALDVIAAYWTLVLRHEEVKIREVSVTMAQNLRDLVDRRIRGGQAPRGEIVQADATVAERELQVRQAQLSVIEAERELLTLTFMNRGGSFKWESTLVPSESPSTTPIEVTFETELALALKSRPEVRRFQRDLAVAKLDVDIAGNERKPQLDVYAETGLAGLAGQSNVASGDPSAPSPRLVGGFGRSVGNITGFEAPYWEVGLVFSLPLGNRTRAGAERQAELRLEQVKVQDVPTLIAIDVRSAIQALDVARSRLVGAKARVKLAEENVDVYRKRYEGGASTIFDTLRVQDELARARAELVLAAAEQEVAHARLLAARGTLLETFSVKATK